MAASASRVVGAMRPPVRAGASAVSTKNASSRVRRDDGEPSTTSTLRSRGTCSVKSCTSSSSSPSSSVRAISTRPSTEPAGNAAPSVFFAVPRAGTSTNPLATIWFPTRKETGSATAGCAELLATVATTS